ncbi:MAG: phage integrase N-terminal SAM-like domain-containing protein, partial [Candidatus Bathyarchaeia archaeon]
MNGNEMDVKRFLDIKQANGQSKHTIKSQRTIPLKLNRFLNGKSFRQTSEDDVMAFFSMLNGSCSGSTVTLSKIVIKSFYRHLYSMKRHEYPLQVTNLVVSGGNKRKLPIRPEDVITKEDIVELLRWCDNFRDKAMVVT